jgi:ubiquitin
LGSIGFAQNNSGKAQNRFTQNPMKKREDDDVICFFLAACPLKRELCAICFCRK